MSGKIHFGVYELDRDAMELRKHGVAIRLQEQPLRVLVTLVQRPGEIVTREELQQQIWGKDTFVDFEQSLNKAVNRLREALNDEAGQPRYVETVPRRGYRFIAPVTELSATEPSRLPVFPKTTVGGPFKPSVGLSGVLVADVQVRILETKEKSKGGLRPSLPTHPGDASVLKTPLQPTEGPPTAQPQLAA